MQLSEQSARCDAVATRAVIDIGSNTVRLVVYGGSARTPEILHNEKVSARLGKGVGETGRIGRKAASAALAALARYRCLIDLMGVDRVDVVATAAARDAINGPAFLDEVRALGFSPRLLSGEEEALAGAAGVSWAFPAADGVVVDLGGGSLELTEISGAVCSHGVSLPVGSLRLPALRAKGNADFRRKLRAMLERAEWTADPGKTLYLVGGSLRSLARYAIARSKSPIDDPHGLTLSAEAAAQLARSVVRSPPTDPALLVGISSARFASLPHTAALLTVLMEYLQPERLVFSSWGLREGVLFAEAPAELRTIDPLTAGARDFAATRGVPPQLVQQVADWIGGATSSTDHVEGAKADRMARLRYAATALCLASTRIEANLRPSLARDWALRKRWIGIDVSERYMLAAAILAHANVRTPHPMLAPLNEGLLRIGQSWGLAVRLCRRFSAQAPAAIAASTLQRSDGGLVLHPGEGLAALVDESARKDLGALADHLGLGSAIAADGAT